MKFIDRFFCTKILFYIALSLSFLSILTVNKGYGEIYPFFFWKLYTQPLGSNGTYLEYRIYARNGIDNYKRIPISDLRRLEKDDCIYLLNSIASEFVNGKSDSALLNQRFVAFLNEIEPKYDSYRIVKEIYRPLEVYLDSSKYDTITIVEKKISRVR